MSSAYNTFIPDQEAIPVVSSDIFENYPSASLAIARVSAEEVLSGSGSIALGYARLRANVYIDQTGMLPAHHRRPDGGEHDEDDARSIHFVGLENRGDGEVAVIGAMRLIQKSVEHPRALPIEHLFPDRFAENPIELGAFEASRYIARGERRNKVRSKIAIIQSAIAHAERHELGRCFAVVEPPVETDFARLGVPVFRIAEPKFIEEYNDTNIGLELGIYDYARSRGIEGVRGAYVSDSAPYVFGDIR